MHEAFRHGHVGDRRHAERNCARLHQHFDHGRAAARHVPPQRLIARRRRIASDADLVLHRERQPGSASQLVSTRPSSIDTPRELQDSVGVDRVDEAEELARLVLPYETCHVHLRRQLSGVNVSHDIACGHLQQLGVTLRFTRSEERTTERIPSAGD